MIRPKNTEGLDLGDRAYEPNHLKEVFAEMNNNFPSYFKSFSNGDSKGNTIPHFTNSNFKVITKQKKTNSKNELTKKFSESIEKFESEQPNYKDFFDKECLEEYEDNPNAFKTEMQKKVPIIRRSMQSREKDMKRFQSNYRLKSGRELLDVTRRIIEFGNDYVKAFDEIAHERTKTVDDLGLSDLSEEKYISHLVIGGGIKSCFLFSLYPNAFSYRSQNAIWALYFLTNKKNFGFQDDSEFLMIHPDEGRTHQNYHYPCDLFGHYALNLYLLLKEACAKEGVVFQNQYRYIYLDAFLNHIAEIKNEEIWELKKDGDYEE